MVTTEHVCWCQSLWNGKKSSPFPAVFSAPVQREQSFVLRSLCCFLSRGSLDPSWPSTELLLPGIVHCHPHGWFSCGSSFPGPPEQPRPNSFLPSGVLSWLLNFLKIPFQITSFFPCPTFCPSSPVPGTFYSGIFHQTCLLNFSICHSVEVVLSHMLKNTWYCSTNNAIQTYRHPFTGVYLGFFRKSELQYA